MKVCDVRNVCIGEGQPKICIPIVGRSDQEILDILKSFEDLTYDLIELRVDFYNDINHYEKLLNMLKQLRAFTDKPLLFTYRSQREGGEIQLTDEQYKQLVLKVCQSQYIDFIDIELMSGNALVYELVEIAHQYQVKVVMSNHDFDKTPALSIMRERLEKMEILGADLLKIAVMPQCHKDVITLLNLTMEMSEKANKPIITMAMGKMGAISRITGELTGSSITFASAGKASAPGQISVHDMNVILGAIHHD